jgi:hypothetical protein
MDEYLKNLYSRLRRHSAELNQIEIFVDRSWLYIDDNKNRHEYNFLRDMRLIMSLNGTVAIGTWELLPSGKLLINRVHDNILLENLFIDNALLVLQKSGTTDSAFILLDPAKIQDLDVVKYLVILEAQKQLNEIPSGSVANNPLTQSSESFLSKGTRAPLYSAPIINGTYQIRTNGYVTNIIEKPGGAWRGYYIQEYSFHSRKIFIRQNLLGMIMKGDRIENHHENLLPFQKLIKIAIEDKGDKKLLRLRIDNNGFITAVYNLYF